MKRTQVSRSDARRISELENQLGSRTLRTILSGESQRIMRPERLANIEAGRGRLTDAEIERIKLASANAQQIGQLKKRGQSRGNQEWKNNRALRDWMQNAKERGAKRRDDRSREMKAIRSLRFFGISPSSGRGYVRKAAA